MCLLTRVFQLSDAAHVQNRDDRQFSYRCARLMCASLTNSPVAGLSQSHFAARPRMQFAALPALPYSSTPPHPSSIHPLH